MRLLLVEDDARMAAAIRRGLRFEGIAADVAADGRHALGMVRATEYDAVVLDVMLPDLDGFQTCRRLRADGVWVPIIMLTARDAIDDRVRGLDGAPTTTSPSRSRSPSCSPASGRSRAAAPRSAPRS